jgi:hypothetical protein
MKAGFTFRAILWASVVGFLMSSFPAMAQLYQGQARPRSLGRRAMQKNYIKELQDLAATLSRQYQVKIVVDPALMVTAPPKAPSENATIQAAMDSLARQIKNAAWKRVYLNQAQAASPPPAAKLAATVRALDLLEQNALVLEDPTSRTATSFVKNFRIPENFSEALAAQQFSPNAIYVLYSTLPMQGGDDGTGRSLQEQMLELQRRQMELMLQVDDPDLMAQMMAQGMQMWQGLDPQTRGRFMAMMMRAGMQMWQNMPPEQRQQILQSMQEMFQQGFGNLGGPPPPPGPPPPGAP